MIFNMDVRGPNLGDVVSIEGTLIFGKRNLYLELEMSTCIVCKWRPNNKLHG